MTTYRESIPADLNSWELADPGRLLRAFAKHVPLTVERTYLALVREPATSQALETFTRLWDAVPDDHEERRLTGVRALTELGLREWEFLDDEDRLTSAIISIVARRGRAVTQDIDLVPYTSLRYANNGFQRLIGDELVVTEHGWFVALSPDICGTSPRLALSA